MAGAEERRESKREGKEEKKSKGFSLPPCPHNQHLQKTGESPQGRGRGPGGVLRRLVRALVRLVSSFSYAFFSLSSPHPLTHLSSLPPSLPCPSKNLVPEWDKAATALKGVVTVAAVDASVAQSLAQKYDVKVREGGGRGRRTEKSISIYRKALLALSFLLTHSSSLSSIPSSFFFTSSCRCNNRDFPRSRCLAPTSASPSTIR